MWPDFAGIWLLVLIFCKTKTGSNVDEEEDSSLVYQCIMKCRHNAPFLDLFFSGRIWQATGEAGSAVGKGKLWVLSDPKETLVQSHQPNTATEDLSSWLSEPNYKYIQEEQAPDGRRHGTVAKKLTSHSPKETQVTKEYCWIVLAHSDPSQDDLVSVGDITCAANILV